MTTTSHIITGRIADPHQAILTPMDYELSFTYLGWTLSFIGDSMATMITDKHAEEIMSSMKVEMLREKTKHDMAEEAAYQQSLLNQEASV